VLLVVILIEARKPVADLLDQAVNNLEDYNTAVAD